MKITSHYLYDTACTKRFMLCRTCGAIWVSKTDDYEALLDHRRNAVEIAYDKRELYAPSV